MNNQTIIRQLEKALECKELKEMKMRVEVLVDILKGMPGVMSGAGSNWPQPPQPMPQSVSQPTQPKVAGAGAIVSANSEQLPLVRPD